MIVTCPTCTTRLQLDDAKIPERAFSVRCPKCQQIINAERSAPQGLGGEVVANGDALPPTGAAQMTAATPPAANPPRESQPEEPLVAPRAVAGDADLMRLLAALVQRIEGEPGTSAQGTAPRQRDWNQRRALVCIGSIHRDAVARALAASGYQVYAAEDTARAMEHMREEKMDVLVLDNEFDMAAQGATFINRELTALRMSDRRRLTLVQLSPSARTGDAHAAFLNNANLLVNNADIESLPQVLEKNTRELRELYRDFDKALSLAGL